MLSRSQKIAAKNIEAELTHLRAIVDALNTELASATTTPETLQKLGHEIASVGAGVVQIATWWRGALDELAVLQASPLSRPAPPK